MNIHHKPRQYRNKILLLGDNSPQVRVSASDVELVFPVRPSRLEWFGRQRQGGLRSRAGMLALQCSKGPSSFQGTHLPL